MRANADTDRVGVFIEQVDEDFLSRNGYDPSSGELYKFTQRSNLNPVFADVTTGVDRESGQCPGPRQRTRTRYIRTTGDVPV